MTVIIPITTISRIENFHVVDIFFSRFLFLSFQTFIIPSSYTVHLKYHAHVQYFECYKINNIKEAKGKIFHIVDVQVK